MSALTKTISTVATATIIATGVYVVYDDNTDSSQTVVDDVVASTVEVPTVSIPVVDIPIVNIPKVDIPKVDIPEVMKFVVLDQNCIRDLNLESISIETPKNSEIPITAETVSIIKTDDGSYKVQIPSFSTIIKTETAQTVNIPSEKIDTVEIEITNPKIETVKKYDDRIPEIIAITKLQKILFRDQRNIQYNKDFGIDSEAWPQWRKIYQNNQKYNMSYVPISEKFRMIAEVQVPQNQEEAKILDDNLETYEKLGYNSVLFTFSGQEKIYEAEDVIDFIKSKGMKVFFSYSGPENLSFPVFQDTNMLSEKLQRFAKKCDGYILGWRRTALHLFIPDEQFTSFIIKNLRDSNPNILIIGESYYGANAESNDKSVVSYNIPANCSGTLISGVGFSSVNIKGCIDSLFSEASSINKIGVVVGDRPYFLTSNPNNLGFEKNFQIKKKIEEKFIKYGCVGTITLHGDTGVMVDSSGARITSDALQKFKFK